MEEYLEEFWELSIFNGVHGSEVQGAALYKAMLHVEI